MIPDYFSLFIADGLVNESNIKKTDDGFFCLNKSISDILAEREIHTFPADDGYELKCDKYFDDWYIYAIKKGKDFVYSLFKLREQEYDMYAGERADTILPELP